MGNDGLLDSYLVCVRVTIDVTVLMLRNDEQNADAADCWVYAVTTLLTVEQNAAVLMDAAGMGSAATAATRAPMKTKNIVNAIIEGR